MHRLVLEVQVDPPGCRQRKHVQVGVRRTVGVGLDQTDGLVEPATVLLGPGHAAQSSSSADRNASNAAVARWARCWTLAANSVRCLPSSFSDRAEETTAPPTRAQIQTWATSSTNRCTMPPMT